MRFGTFLALMFWFGMSLAMPSANFLSTTPKGDLISRAEQVLKGDVTERQIPRRFASLYKALPQKRMN